MLLAIIEEPHLERERCCQNVSYRLLYKYDTCLAHVPRLFVGLHRVFVSYQLYKAVKLQPLHLEQMNFITSLLIYLCWVTLAEAA